MKIITKLQFIELSKNMAPLRNSCNRSPRTFDKIRNRYGNSLSIHSALFQLRNKRIISKAIACARVALKEHFVSKFLWFSRMTRDKFVS